MATERILPSLALATVRASLCAACGMLSAAPSSGILWNPIPERSDEFSTHGPNSRGDSIDDSKLWDDHPQWDGRLSSQFSASNSWGKGGMLNKGLHMIFDMDAFFWRGLPTVVDLNDSNKNTVQVDRVRA